MQTQIKCFIALLSIFLTFAQPSLARGPANGGGGRVIQCKPGTGFPKAGLYALDYVLDMQQNPGREWIVIDNPQAHLRAIVEKFNGPLNEIYYRAPLNGWSHSQYFQNFIDQLPTIWKPMIVPLRMVDDAPKLPRPQGCVLSTEQQITTALNGNYFTNVGLEAELKKDDLQWSVHLVHEMLRTVFSDSLEIARWNQVLHSRAFFQLKGKNLVDYLAADPKVMTPLVRDTGDLFEYFKAIGEDQGKKFCEQEINRFYFETGKAKNDVSQLRDARCAAEPAYWNVVVGQQQADLQSITQKLEQLRVRIDALTVGGAARNAGVFNCAPHYSLYIGRINEVKRDKELMENRKVCN